MWICLQLTSFQLMWLQYVFHCMVQDRLYKLVSVIWVEWYHGAILMKTLPPMWVSSNNVDNVIDVSSILLITSGRVPWELNSHGVNGCSSSGWSTNWNIQKCADQNQPTQCQNNEQHHQHRITAISQVCETSVCTVSGTEYGPGTTVTAEILMLYILVC